MKVETAIRAWVEVERKKRDPKQQSRAKVPWRAQSIGGRALVFDTETTTDFTQMLLFGAFRIYEHDSLDIEGLIIADNLNSKQLRTVNVYAAERHLRVCTRTLFIEQVFYPEVYVLGTLCIFFNGPFDLSRLAIHAGLGRGKNRRKFSLQLSPNIYWPRVRIEAVSGRAAFIEFAPKRKLQDWEKPFFRGRFLDLATPTTAFTGERHSLKSAGRTFAADFLKSKIDKLGIITEETIHYCRNDVHATWALYQKLKAEYEHHPFATVANEREQPKNTLPITRIYSSATIAKHYLKMLGF
jgi:hypothetical protein